MSGLLIFLGVLASDAHFDLKLAFLFYPGRFSSEI